MAGDKSIIVKGREESFSSDDESSSQLPDLDISSVEDLDSFLDEMEKFSSAKATRLLQTKFEFLSMGGKLFFYNNGCYKPEAEVRVRKLIQEKNPETTRHQRNEVISHLIDASYRDENELEMNPSLLPVKNGILDIDTLELQPHDPGIFSWNSLPVKFNPDATCPKIEEFLDQILPEEKDRQLFLEFCGFVLYRSYPFHRFLMAIGPPGSGKSTALGILENLIGEENTVSTDIYSLEMGRFTSSKLHRKMLCLQADISGVPVKRSPMLKSLTGGDLVPAEFKFGAQFQFRNFSKLCFSANSPPEFKEGSNAVFRRLIFIEFNQVFVEGKTAVPNLLQDLCTPEEMSGFLNLCLRHLHQLLENKKFSFDMTPEEVRTYYERASNSLAWFVNEHTEVDETARISKAKFYKKYVDFCIENKGTIKSMYIIGKELPALLGVSSGRMGTNKATAWIGVNVTYENKKENDEKPYATDEDGNLILKEVIENEEQK